MNEMERLEQFALSVKTAPTLGEMRRRTLADKGIDGPTGAHVIEEIHTPLNIAYVTFTTGSTAFQNIVGVTENEIPGRIEAAKRLFDRVGVRQGDTILFTYPPLVNVFSKAALLACGVRWVFMDTSSRDAFLVALYKEQPTVVIGESSFMRAALSDAEKLGVIRYLPRQLTLLAAGTPLDPALAPTAADLLDARVHDLYGCQEFGWLTVDGVPLRNDIALVDAGDGFADLFVGGLPTSDRFSISGAGHVLNPDGKIITYTRRRLDAEPCVFIEETTAGVAETVHRLAKTILRIKGKIVKVSEHIQLSCGGNAVSVRNDHNEIIARITDTALLDSLLEAQLAYQRGGKKDAAWIKERE